MNSECIDITKSKRIVFEENKRKFVAHNEKQIEIIKYDIDKCLIKDIQNQKSCDKGLKSSFDFFFIELKGKNIIQACKQIIDTIEYFKLNFPQEISAVNLNAVIIPTKNSVPKLKSNPDYLKLSKKVENRVFVKSRIYQITL